MSIEGLDRVYFGGMIVDQFINGFLFTAGGIAAVLCILTVAAFCEFVTKLTESRGREEIRNAIVDNAASICGLADQMKQRRSEFE
jgi:hypothetical protein